MANTIPAGLQNNIISQSALEAFAKKLAPLQAFSSSFNDEAVQRGKTINITTLANTSTAAAFSGTYTAQDTTYATTEISLTNHKFVTWHVTDTEASQSSAVELNRFGYQKGSDLADAVFQDILGEVTVANYGDAAGFTGLPAAFDGDDVADLRQDMIDENCPVDQCALVIGNAYYTALLKDSNINGAIDYGSADIIRDGRIPSLFGVGYIFETASIPTNSENLIGFISHPSAMAVAMRYLEPTNTQEYIDARRVYDEDSGMVLGYREFYSPDTGTQTAVLEAVYGFKVAVSGALRRMISA
jgi:hypothetical protein